MNNIFANKEVTEYKNKVDGMEKAELEKMMQLALAYNRSLPRSFPADPFSGTNISDFKGTEFENFPMVKHGEMIGYLEVPTIDVYLPIYYGTGDDVIEKNLGLVENTSLPVGGSGTHAVIAGHTGMASKKLFSDLNQLKKGDLFFVHVLNRHFAYKVDNIDVVLPEETEGLMIKKDLDLVTLLTCTPLGINDHRLLVRGARTEYNFDKTHERKTFWTIYGRLINSLAVVMILSEIMIVFFIVRKFKKMNKTGKKV